MVFVTSLADIFKVLYIIIIWISAVVVDVVIVVVVEVVVIELFTIYQLYLCTTQLMVPNT